MTNKNLPAVVSFIIAAALIALVFFYPSKPRETAPAASSTPATSTAQTTVPDDALAAVILLRPTDHYRGNLNAPVKIIEYSDTECPFCKMFHVTMQQIIKDYPGKVVWIYRHFPLDSLHPKARREAEAVECAARVGGEEKFWAYLDRIFAITPSNNGLDPAELPKIAQTVNLDLAKFNLCLSTGATQTVVQNQVDEAIAAGAQGTPFNIVVWPDGREIVPGAFPYGQMTKLIDNALNARQQ